VGWIGFTVAVIGINASTAMTDTQVSNNIPKYLNARLANAFILNTFHMNFGQKKAGPFQRTGFVVYRE